MDVIHNMIDQKPCSDCFMLVKNRQTSAHKNLIEKFHIHNDTLYQCRRCRIQLRLTHVPHRWSLIDNESN